MVMTRWRGKESENTTSWREEGEGGCFSLQFEFSTDKIETLSCRIFQLALALYKMRGLYILFGLVSNLLVISAHQHGNSEVLAPEILPAVEQSEQQTNTMMELGGHANALKRMMAKVYNENQHTKSNAHFKSAHAHKKADHLHYHSTNSPFATPNRFTELSEQLQVHNLVGCPGCTQLADAKPAADANSADNDPSSGLHRVQPVAGPFRVLVVDPDDGDLTKKRGASISLSKKLSTDEKELQKAAKLIERGLEEHENTNDFIAAACSSPTCGPIKEA